MHGAPPDAPVILTQGPLGLASGAESTLAEREGSEGEEIEERPWCPLGPMGACHLQPFAWRWHWTQRSPFPRLWRVRWTHITSQPLEGGSWGAKSLTGKRGFPAEQACKATPGWQRGRDRVAAPGGCSGLMARTPCGLRSLPAEHASPQGPVPRWSPSPPSRPGKGRKSGLWEQAGLQGARLLCAGGLRRHVAGLREQESLEPQAVWAERGASPLRPKCM